MELEHFVLELRDGCQVTSAGVNSVCVGVGTGTGEIGAGVWLTTQTPPIQLAFELHIAEEVQGLFGGARQTFKVLSQIKPELQFASVAQDVPTGAERTQRKAK